jgi:hypothetical protein
VLEIEKPSHVIISRCMPLTSTDSSSICCIRPMIGPAMALEKLRTAHMRFISSPGGTLLRLRSEEETLPSVLVLAFLLRLSPLYPVGRNMVCVRYKGSVSTLCTYCHGHIHISFRIITGEDLRDGICHLGFLVCVLGFGAVRRGEACSTSQLQAQTARACS